MDLARSQKKMVTIPKSIVFLYTTNELLKNFKMIISNSFKMLIHFGTNFKKVYKTHTLKTKKSLLRYIKKDLYNQKDISCSMFGGTKDFGSSIFDLHFISHVNELSTAFCFGDVFMLNQNLYGNKQTKN